MFSSYVSKLERHINNINKVLICINKAKALPLPTLYRKSPGDVTEVSPPSWGTVLPLTRVCPPFFPRDRCTRRWHNAGIPILIEMCPSFTQYISHSCFYVSKELQTWEDAFMSIFCFHKISALAVFYTLPQEYS